MGLDLEYYWNLTPKQYAKHQSAYLKIQEDEIKKADTLNWSLGQYIAFAFNDPKKYPKKPFTDKKEQDVQTPEEMEMAAMIITAQLGGEINGSTNN